MHFVATNSIAENVARVVQRAQAGGHGASEREIRAIHHASVANLREAIASFGRVRVYDSTARWEALRLWRERRRKKLDVLLKYARMRHVERAMRPYLEAMQ